MSPLTWLRRHDRGSGRCAPPPRVGVVMPLLFALGLGARLRAWDTVAT